MRLLVDEPLSPAIADQLSSRGHDVVAATRVGLAGIDDLRVLSWAVADRRAVVTNNIRDFRPLHAASLAASTPHFGFVLVPSGAYSFRRDRLGNLITALDRLLHQHPADDALSDTEHFL